jgi:hypothetical protein
VIRVAKEIIILNIFFPPKILLTLMDRYFQLWTVNVLISRRNIVS